MPFSLFMIVSPWQRTNNNNNNDDDEHNDNDLDKKNPNLLLITKLTIKSYLQLISLKNYSGKALFILFLSIKKKRHLI